MVKKEQGQDNYFNQQSILLTFASLHVDFHVWRNNYSILATNVNSVTAPHSGAITTSLDALQYALLIEIIVLSLFFFNHCHFLHSCSFP